MIADAFRGVGTFVAIITKTACPFDVGMEIINVALTAKLMSYHTIDDVKL